MTRRVRLDAHPSLLPTAIPALACVLAAFLTLRYVQVDDRAAKAHSLLSALKAAGAAVDRPLEARPVAYGGHGVFVREPVKAGARIMWLPRVLALTADGDDASLPLALARERRSPSSAVRQAYLDTLPAECPSNLATRSRADLALASASLHGWKVELMEREEAALLRELPDADADERRYWLCMKQSRAFGGDGHGAARLLPFFDLLNHHDEPTVREVPTDHGTSLVALRDLRAGEELTFRYVESPSRARLLTSFGFDGGAPAATLVAAELPPRDPAWLAEVGCAGTVRTELHLEPSGELSFRGLARGVRCIRLHVYTREESQHALDIGHLYRPSAAGDDVDEESLLGSLLRKDAMIFSRTAAMCDAAQSAEQRAAQAALAESVGVSADLKDAIAEETAALLGCAQLGEAASRALAARLGH